MTAAARIAEMPTIRLLWLILAIGGAVLPWVYFMKWFLANGFDLRLMIDTWNATDAGTGLVYDLTWAWIVLTVWVLWESIPRRDWRSMLAIPAGVLIGVSCALPLYLFFRSRPGYER